jgi:hypothetical protein
MVPSPGNPQSLNRYAYAGNNPLKYVDPAGHFAIAPLLLGMGLVGGAFVVGAMVFEGVEAAKMGYGELTVAFYDTIQEAATHPVGGGAPFDPIALRAAINIQEVGMLYDDLPNTGSRGLGAVRPDVVKDKLGLSYSMDQIQNDHVLNVKLRAALMAQELAKCSGCSKTDQYYTWA